MCLVTSYSATCAIAYVWKSFMWFQSARENKAGMQDVEVGVF